MTRELSVGYSPCPNDTFAFYALEEGLVDADVTVDVHHHDVETLNERAAEGAFDASKLSIHGFGRVADDYALLRSGGALGRGVGPIVVARDDLEPSRVADPDVDVVIPGERTTANLLLRCYAPDLHHADARLFDEIMPAVRDGEYDAGLVIHEGRFTYEDYGLTRVLDLGEWWEAETGDPVPLGGIAVRRDLGREAARELERGIRESVEYARAHPEEPMAYVRRHADAMADDVMQRHIELYVNEYTVDMGDEGVDAIETMLARGVEAGLLDGLPDGLMAVG